MSDPMRQVRMATPMYGGLVDSDDSTVRLPFALPGELFAVGEDDAQRLEPSPERVHAACVHFGTCGGCQYQMVSYDEQIRMKYSILHGLLHTADIKVVPEIFNVSTGEPYGYRNRIRLRIERVDGTLRFGYNIRGSATFLPITMCPIAAPVLWDLAENLLAVAKDNPTATTWLDAATEVEFFADDELAKVQMTLFCPPRTALPPGTFAHMMDVVKQRLPQIVGASTVALDAKSGLTGKVFDSWGAAGLNYRVGDQTYWIARGCFFQTNRFLLPKLVELVTQGRSGTIAWDLFAGVGLFSRVLVKSFAQVTAVEANPTATRDLAVALKKLGPQHRAVQKTTLDFLRVAALDREHPDLVVLDPPRAGAGVEACELIAQIDPREIVYVSCDPTTLARDWKSLEQHGYRATSTHLVDLFPQTFHIESVVAFERAS